VWGEVSAASGAVGSVVAVGAVLAVATLPSADHLQDRMSARIGLDGG